MDNFRDSYFNVTWDLTKKHLRGTFWGKQYDTGRGFAVTIVEGGQVTVPSTETVRLKWEKPDSTEGYVTAVVVDDKFLIEDIDQMFTVHGAVRSDLEIWRGGKVISSITFYVSVEKAVAVDAIESSSDFTALQEALADVGDMQAQVDAVIANATVDSEVILARGAEPTLGARLDGTDAQLAETDQRIDDIITTPVPTGEIIAQEIIDARQGELSLPANITKIKSQLAQTEQQLNYKMTKKVGDGNLAKMADLSQEVKEAMTGGSVAVVGQNSVTHENIVNRNVLQSKLKNLIPKEPLTVNLFNKDELLTGGYYSGQGIWTESVDYVSSDFIPSERGVRYKISSSASQTFSYWDEDFNFVSGGLSSQPIVNNVSIKYIRVRVPVDEIEQFMLTKESEYPSSYVPGINRYELDSTWRVLGKNIEDVTQKTERTINLFDKTTVTEGGYYTTSGIWVDSVDYVYSDFIPVELEESYVSGPVASIYNTTFWDKNFDLVSGQGGKDSTIMSSKIKYLRVPVYKGNLDDFMVTKSSDWQDEYVPYYVDKNILNENKWGTIPDKVKNELSEMQTATSHSLNLLNDNHSEPTVLDLEDWSGYDQPFHPSVVFIDGGLGGSEYWMVQTPYPIGSTPYRDRWECPVVYKSNDGKDWEVVANPLDDLTQAEVDSRDYMSDPHIVYRKDTQTLEVWYRLSNRIDGTLWTELLRKTTTDGINWTDREVMIPHKLNTDSDFMRSPCVIWDNEKMLYRAWYQNDAGLWYRESVDGTTWNVQQPLALDIPQSAWHIDVNYFDNAYHLLIHDINTEQLIYYSSDDGLNFNRNRILIDIRDNNPLYSNGLYRSVSIKDKEDKIRIYFSTVSGRRTNVALMIENSFADFQPTRKVKANMIIMENGKTLEETIAHSNQTVW